MLRTPADGLHGRPQIPGLRQQIPARRLELRGVNAAAFIHALRGAGNEVVQSLAPGDVAIAFDNGVRSPSVERFVGIKRRMDPAENDVRAPGARQCPDGVAAKRIPGMNTNAYHIAWVHGLRIQGTQRFVANNRTAKGLGRCPRQHIQPPRRDDRVPKELSLGLTR